MALSPAIAIDQKTTSKNPRSTVGTVTEIYDYLRLLYARIGIPYSPETGLPIESQTVSQMADRIMALEEGTKILLLAPIVRGHKGEHRKMFLDLQKQGFTRLKSNGKMYEITEVPPLDKNKKHDIEVVVDRLVVKEDLGNRLPDSIETGPETERWVADGRSARWRHLHPLLQVRMPNFRLHHLRNRTAPVLVQQPLRCLPGVRRPGHRTLLRP